MGGKPDWETVNERVCSFPRTEKKSLCPCLCLRVNKELITMPPLPPPMLCLCSIVDEPLSLGTCIPLSVVLFHIWSIGPGSIFWSVGRGSKVWSVGRWSKVWSFRVQFQACSRDTFRQHIQGLPRFKTRKALKEKKSLRLLGKINCFASKFLRYFRKV